MKLLVVFVFLGESEDSAIKYYPAAAFHILIYIPLSFIFATYIHYKLCIKTTVLNNAKIW
jgi:hypothetical protein